MTGRGYSEVAPALLRLDADDLKLRGSPRIPFFRFDSFGVNRPRYSRGGMPILLMNAVRICSSLLKPQRCATDLMRLPGCTRRRRAASTRMASTVLAGVRPRLAR